MASIYDIKPRFQDLLRPLSDRCAKAGITANQVTLAALGLSAVTGLFLALFPGKRLVLLLVPVVMFVRMALNAVDGMLAREHDMKTPLGAMLNELGDVVSDSCLYLPFALTPGLAPALIVLAVILSIISEMTGVVAVQIGASRRYDGPMGKSDRAFVFGLLAVLLATGHVPVLLLNSGLVLVCLAIVATILNRGRKAIAEVSTR